SFVPEKITSSCLRARRRRELCSPRTQRMASETLLLPEPFGPTTAVTPEPYSKTVRLAKLLNPWMESFFRYMVTPRPRRRDGTRPHARRPVAPRACSHLHPARA